MKGWLKKGYLIAGLSLLVLVDMWVINLRYLNSNHFKNKRVMEVPFIPTAADQKIMEDKDPNFRVFNRAVNTFNDASTSYFHKSIGGYHGAKLRRYQEMIDFHLNANNFKLLDMLNMKYIIRDIGEGNLQAVANDGALGNAWFVKEVKWVNNPDEEYIFIGDAALVKPLSANGLVTVNGTPVQGDTLSMNKPIKLSVSAMPDSVFSLRLADYRLQDSIRYRFGVNPSDTSPDFINISSPGAAGRVLPEHMEVEKVYSFDPATRAVIDKKWRDKVDIEKIIPDPDAFIDLVSYKANYLKYNASCATDQVAVFSEIFYEKGWNAYLDGKMVPHGRANWLLRAMVVPAGVHTIEFKFEPSVIRIGEPIAIAASVLVLLLVLGVIGYQIRLYLKG